MAATRKSIRRIMIGSLALIALLGMAALAHAKMMPYVEPLDGDWGGIDDPFVLDDPHFAAFYGRLDSSSDVDAIAMTFNEPAEAMRSDLVVPVCGDRFVNFYPSMALIGPGLDRPDDLAALPFDLPAEFGAIIMESQRPTGTVARPISDEWQLFEQLNANYEAMVFEADIPQAGEYMLVIWDAGKQRGAYTLITGAVHPTGDVFPGEREFNTRFALIRSGAWIGQYCEIEK
ncbi:MAG: hypothetical protein JXA10_13620 [Anaerolineae bacterium]|nr:hypothetical protein [Anaerolineae bacterium]